MRLSTQGRKMRTFRRLSGLAWEFWVLPKIAPLAWSALVALAAVAHPDDIEFMMAGTLLLLKDAGAMMLNKLHDRMAREGGPIRLTDH